MQTRELEKKKQKLVETCYAISEQPCIIQIIFAVHVRLLGLEK